jgi:DNA polymerase elongation subunit (family B)
MCADYTVRKGMPVILIRARDENGKVCLFEKEDYTPYFWAPKHQVTDTDAYMTSVDGTEVAKVYVGLPKDVRTAREAYSVTYEADVLYPWRFLIDKEIKSGFTVIDNSLVPIDRDNGQKYNKMYLDIETEVTGNAIDPNAAKDMILCIGFSMNGDKIVQMLIRNENEEIAVLYEFIKKVNLLDPDIITGWNVYYDLAYIISRCRKLNIDPGMLSPFGYVDLRYPTVRVMGRNVVDLLAAFKQFYQNKVFPSFKLDDIAARDEYKLGWEKEEKFDYNNKMNRRFLDIIEPYNNDDVQKLIDIDRHLELIDHFDGIRKTAGCSIEDSFTVGRYAGMMLLREYHGKFAVPTGGQFFGAETEKFEGAYVVQPKKGVFKNVIALDFARMYPSIIISFNMSPETLVKPQDVKKYKPEELFEIDGVYFKRFPQGIVPKMLEKLNTARNEVKKKMKGLKTSDPRYKVYDLEQYSYKQMTAAVYGYFAYVGSRLYYPLISKSTTFIGRGLVKQVIAYIDERKMDALYGDTDSILARIIEGDPVEWGLMLEKDINIMFEEKAKTEGWKMPPIIEFEQVYSRLLFSGKKKRYAGLCCWYKGKEADEVIIKGFESKRSDSSPTSQKLQVGALDLILHDKSEKEIRQFVKDSIIRMRKSGDIEEVGIPKPMKKDYKEYGNPGSMLDIIFSNTYMGKNFGVGEGRDSRPYRFYVKRVPDGLPSKVSYVFKGETVVKDVDRIALGPEDDLSKYDNIIDWNVQTAKVIDAKIEPILIAYGLTMSEVKSGQKQMTLGNF